METEEEPQLGRIEAALLEADDPSRFSLVYEEVKTRKASEKRFDAIDVIGTLTPDQIQRIARPYRHLSPDEEWVYNEDAWSSVDEKGNVEKGYRTNATGKRQSPHSETRSSSRSTGRGVRKATP